MRLHIPRKVWLTTALVVVAWGIIWLAMGLPGLSGGAKPPDPTCTTQVIDATADHVLGNFQPIETAAGSLEQRGVKVRVRVIETMPKGGSNVYLSGLAAKCPDWVKPVKLANGTTAYGLGGRMLVMVMARGQTPNIYWGGDLGSSPVFNSAFSAMNQRFKQGDYTGGLSGFLLAVEPSIRPAAPADTQPAGQHSGGLNVAVLLLALLLVALLLGLYLVLRQLSGKRKSRRISRRRLAQASETVASCRPNLAGLTSGLPNITNQGLMVRWEEIDRRCREANKSFQDLGADGTLEDYTQLATDADAIIADAKDFLADVRRIVIPARRASLPPPRRPRPLTPPAPTPDDLQVGGGAPTGPSAAPLHPLMRGAFYIWGKFKPRPFVERGRGCLNNSGLEPVEDDVVETQVPSGGGLNDGVDRWRIRVIFQVIQMKPHDIPATLSGRQCDLPIADVVFTYLTADSLS